jgi:hypothetical protein
MKIQTTASALVSAVVLTTCLASPVVSADETSLPFASEVDSCIAAVYANVNLSDANRVRHVVKQKQRAGFAYAFAIETSVFTDDDETRFAAYCVAFGDGAPSKFRIAQKST